jgi:long-chain-fatty-acid---luciferin-component ligase
VNVKVDLEPLENMFFELSHFMHNPLEAKKLRRQLLKTSFEFHMNNNPDYRSYVSHYLSSENQVISFDDELNVPLMPSSFFKAKDLSVCTVHNDDIIKLCTSSGTQGSLSIVPRDEITLMNFLSSITSLFPSLLGLDRTGNHRAVILGPSADEAGDIWFSYAMACLTLQVTAEYCEKNSFFDIDYAVETIRSAINNNEDLIIVGPPFRILEVCQKIKSIKNWPSISMKSYIISAGGWKNRQREAIDKEAYRAKVAASFATPQPSQIRDCYNMVELNSVLLECEHHKKHIPPWLEVQARDPSSNSVLPDGKNGILAFFDASSVSYPCFILSEDFGVVNSGVCNCGRYGQTLEITRRMGRVEARGCALKLADGKSDESSIVKKRFFTSYYRNPEVIGK